MALAAIRAGAGAVKGRLRGFESAGLGAADRKTIERLVLSLGELKGIAMKVGQILSYIDDSLPAETRKLLSVLQAHSQPTPFARIEEAVRSDLGSRAEPLLTTMDRKPAAVASIGQVHRARLPDGTPVAVKVRHPGIESAITADFKAAHTATVLAHLLAPGSNLDEVIAEARSRFLEECDYALERCRQERFASLYAGHQMIRIPAVHPEWCSGRILTTTWHDGRALEEFAASAGQEERNQAGRALYDFYVGTLYRRRLFNADPHPGNLLFHAGGALTILDHGCVREFDAAAVAALAALSRAVRRDDPAGIRGALRALGARNPDGPGFDTTRELVRAFFAPALQPGVRPVRAGVTLDLQNVVRDKRALLRLQIPGKLLFLFRIRFGLFAVLSRIRGEADWQALESGLADEALRAGPPR